MPPLTRILAAARACTVCSASLPLGPRPLLQVGGQAHILLIGQAPGRVAHETGVPWNDASGRRLRTWLGVSDEEFYDPRRIALIPMGLCYPGKGKSGDLAPRPECAPLWQGPLRAELRRVSLTVYIGAHAFGSALADRLQNLSAAVRATGELLPERAVLPHPSPRNSLWLAQNRWFEAEILPQLRARVRQVLR